METVGATDTFLALYYPYYSEILTDDDSGEGNNARITWVASYDKEYCLCVKSPGDNTGEYQLSVLDQGVENE